MTRILTRSRSLGVAITIGSAVVCAAPAVRAEQSGSHVTDIRTGRHATFDRVVIDLKGATPDYRVRYVREVRADGSGKVVDTRGRANLLVRLTPADAHDGNGQPTYDGPRRFTTGYPALREVAFAGDFEGTVSIALGVSHKTGFNVMTLSNPTRVVIDISH